ncbi:MAG: RHS repeat-associated core domain-containing protein, partial [Bryobacterales bacterium]|nr:RHS repeat-associated core domain-containing protein [Bryobacterales bacterium]
MGGYRQSYDGENRLRESTVGGVTTTYSYDGQGRRVKKESAEGGEVYSTTVYVYDAAGQMAAEYASGTGEEAPCGTCYLAADHLGSTRLVMDEQGTVKERHDYLPYGEEIAAGVGGRGVEYGGVGVRQKFTGKERDGETGLDYFGARYFSGAQGRFTSPDKPFADQFVEDPQSWNLYTYVRNNPLRYVDDDGRGARELWFGITNAVSSN